MIKKFSSPKMRNRQLVFAPKIEYQLVAETLLRRDKLRKANLSNLQFPFWCARQESNLRSHGPQPCALSTELRARVRNCLQPARLHLSVKSLRLQAISSFSIKPSFTLGLDELVPHFVRDSLSCGLDDFVVYIKKSP